jgi:hypothetical protein
VRARVPGLELEQHVGAPRGGPDRELDDAPFGADGRVHRRGRDRLDQQHAQATADALHAPQPVLGGHVLGDLQVAVAHDAFVVAGRPGRRVAHAGSSAVGSDARVASSAAVEPGAATAVPRSAAPGPKLADSRATRAGPGPARIKEAHAR